MTITISLLFYFLFIPSWLDTILRLGRNEMYVLVFIAALLLSTIVLRRRIIDFLWLKAVIFGAAIGQLSAMVAVAIYSIYIPDGIKRIENSFSAFGLETIIAADIYLSFCLGGWVIGICVFSLAKILLKEKRNQAGSIRSKSIESIGSDSID